MSKVARGKGAGLRRTSIVWTVLGEMLKEEEGQLMEEDKGQVESGYNDAEIERVATIILEFYRSYMISKEQKKEETADSNPTGPEEGQVMEDAKGQVESGNTHAEIERIAAIILEFYLNYMSSKEQKKKETADSNETGSEEGQFMEEAKGQRKSGYTDAEIERVATIIHKMYLGDMISKEQKKKETADSSPTRSEEGQFMEETKGQRELGYTDAEIERVATIIHEICLGYMIRKEQKKKETAESSPTRSEEGQFMEDAKRQVESGYTDAEIERIATIIHEIYLGYMISKEQKEKKTAESSPTGSEAGITGSEASEDNSPKEPGASGTMWRVIKIATPLAAGALAVVGTPVVIGALGFGTGGIIAGSLAAKGMSLAATSGVGMSIISACQSIGALAALTGSQAVAVGGTATAASAGVGKLLGWLWKK